MSVMSDRAESGKSIPYGIHYLLQFCNSVDSIATLTTDVSVFEPLSVVGKSSGVEAPVRINVVIL
jgi:hypothetical protein